MASSPLGSRSKLTRLQWELLEAFFALDQRFFLTGGAALAGFYLGHRATEDLDLFSGPGLDLAEASDVLQQAGRQCGAKLESLRVSPTFRRLLASRGTERCIVDLVIDQAPMLEAEKAAFGAIRVDTLREIAANKICTLLSRSELKDLIDLREILAAGADLSQALADAERKEGGVDPATLAWLLSEITLSADARLPPGQDPVALDAFRRDLVQRLRSEAFRRSRRE